MEEQKSHITSIYKAIRRKQVIEKEINLLSSLGLDHTNSMAVKILEDELQQLNIFLQAKLYNQ